MKKYFKNVKTFFYIYGLSYCKSYEHSRMRQTLGRRTCFFAAPAASNTLTPSLHQLGSTKALSIMNNICKLYYFNISALADRDVMFNYASATTSRRMLKALCFRVRRLSVC